MTFRIHCYIFGIDAERYYVCEGAKILVEDIFEYIFSIYECCKEKKNNDFLLNAYSRIHQLLRILFIKILEIERNCSFFNFSNSMIPLMMLTIFHINITF